MNLKGTIMSKRGRNQESYGVIISFVENASPEKGSLSDGNSTIVSFQKTRPRKGPRAFRGEPPVQGWVLLAGCRRHSLPFCVDRSRQTGTWMTWESPLTKSKIGILVGVHCLVVPELRHPMDCSPPGSAVHGILQAIIGVGCHALLQGIFPTQESNPGLLSSALAGRFFTTGASWEVPYTHTTTYKIDNQQGATA